MLTYKIDVLEALKQNGYTTTKLRNEKLLGENSIQYLREGKMLGAKALNSVCKLLEMQPGNIIQYIDEQ